MKKPWRILLPIILSAVILPVIFFACIYWGAFGHIQNKNELLSFKNAAATVVLSEEGELLGKIFSENRTAISYNQIPPQLINALVSTEDARFFEGLLHHTKDYKAAANWLIGPLKFYCNENNISLASFPLNHEAIVELISLTQSGQVSFNNASTKVLPALIAEPGNTALEMAAILNLLQETDSGAVEGWVNQVILSMPDKVQEYKSGKKGLLGLFAGEVKKISKGKADMQLANKLLAVKLN